MTDAYLIGGVRTPFGRYRGALADTRPDDLAALVLGAALDRAGVPHDAVDEVIFGAANQAGEDNRNVARMAALLAGLPTRSPATPSTGCAPPACRRSPRRRSRSAPARPTSSSPAASSR